MYYQIKKEKRKEKNAACEGGFYVWINNISLIYQK